jgi:hypothetical protein
MPLVAWAATAEAVASRTIPQRSRAIAVAGSEPDLASYLGSLFVPHDADWDSKDATRAEGTFASDRGPGFALAEDASKEFPDLVFRVSSVDSANRFAEARVFRNGDTVGEYDMPGDEFDETAGEDLDEGSLLANLDATVEAYLLDEVEKLAAAAPRR